MGSGGEVMLWYRIRNLLLALGSLSCLGFTGYVGYVLLFSPKPVEIPIGGPFALVDHEGRAVTNETFRGRYQLVYFGYTFCPDVCPTKLTEMTLALDAFDRTSPARAEKIVPIFISVDPDRDSIDVLRSYRTHFHPRLVALTGTAEQLRAVAKAYKTYFSRVYPDKKSRDSNEYLMDHSSYVYLMGPDGRYLTHFTTGTTPEQMAARLAKHVK
jgi:cytochrome oxidase Cu insertion factor (SCO1/SenC/PrrC family)